MTEHVVGLYALVVGVLVFFLAWAAVATRPWVPAQAQDPRLAALAVREQRVRLESVRVQRLVARRFAAYRRDLRARHRQIAAAAVSPAPAVRVVRLPPLVVTRTS